MAKFTNGVNPQKVSYNIGETIIISSTFPKEYPNSGSSEDKQYIAVNMLVGYAINGGAITWNAEKRGNGRDWEDITMTDPIILPTVNADSTVTFYIVSDYNYSSNSDLIFSKLDRSKATPIHTATLQAPNTVPTINGADGDLGEKYTSFTKEYSVNDVNTSDILTVTTKLDNVQLSSFTATRNTNYTVDLSSKWNALSLGRHTIIISVNDGKATATRNYTFTKVSPPNIAPTISGNDEDLGQRADSFTQDYSVNDVNTGDTLNVTEKIDNIVIKTFTATRNTNYTLDLSSKWNALSLEQHIITISVSDGALTTNRTYTFTKSSTANHIPTISGSNGDLGEKKKAFSLDFTVNDLDVTDTLDITIKLDSTINKLIPNVERNKVYTYTIINEDFQALSNGQHTISINVSDGKANSTRTYKFTKTGQTASSEDLAIYEYASKKLDLKKDKDIYIQCKQLDDLILNFEIYNNSIPINIEQFFIEMRGGNSSNLVITSDGITKKGNKVRIECLRALTSVSGEIPIELRFSNADGKQKRTFNVILDVKPSILDSVSNTIVITALEHLDNSLEEARIINTSFNTNIANASKISNNLKDSNKTATYTKNALDLSNATATKTKDALDTSKTNADNTKKSLDTANTLAVTNKDNLEVANVQATKNYDALNALGDVTDLAKKVQTNTTNIADNTKKIEENTTQLSENTNDDAYSTDTGTVNNIIIADITPTIYKIGQRYRIKAKFANTGACTIKVGTLAIIPVKKHVTLDLVTGDILAGQIVTAVYDGTNFQIIPDLKTQFANKADLASPNFSGIPKINSNNISTVARTTVTLTPATGMTVVQQNCYIENKTLYINASVKKTDLTSFSVATQNLFSIPNTGLSYNRYIATTLLTDLSVLLNVSGNGILINDGNVWVVNNSTSTKIIGVNAVLALEV